MKKFLKIFGISLLAIILLGVGFISYVVYRAKYGLPFYDKTPPELAEQTAETSILLFSKTNGFPHTEAIEASIPAFTKMAADNGWDLVETNNAAVFNGDQLPRFDLVIWNNATGKNLTDEQRAAFKAYMEGGGKFMGIHGAGDDSHQWDWYINTLIGAHFSHHGIGPQIQEGVINLECDSANYSLCQPLPSSITRTDEWYVFLDNPRDAGFTVLYTLDEADLNMAVNLPFGIGKDKNFGMGDDHPMVWYKDLPNGGRTFYYGMGHTGGTFGEAEQMKILEQGIKWAGKIE
ncbi:MAG: ThuA domain-containing protein [Bacteroidota bacterium]